MFCAKIVLNNDQTLDLIYGEESYGCYPNGAPRTNFSLIPNPLQHFKDYSEMVLNFDDIPHELSLVDIANIIKRIKEEVPQIKKFTINHFNIINEDNIPELVNALHESDIQVNINGKWSMIFTANEIQIAGGDINQVYSKAEKKRLINFINKNEIKVFEPPTCATGPINDTQQDVDYKTKLNSIKNIIDIVKKCPSLTTLDMGAAHPASRLNFEDLVLILKALKDTQITNLRFNPFTFYNIGPLPIFNFKDFCDSLENTNIVEITAAPHDSSSLDGLKSRERYYIESALRKNRAKQAFNLGFNLSRYSYLEYNARDTDDIEEEDINQTNYPPLAPIPPEVMQNVGSFLTSEAVNNPEELEGKNFLNGWFAYLENITAKAQAEQARTMQEEDSRTMQEEDSIDDVAPPQKRCSIM